MMKLRIRIFFVLISCLGGMEAYAQKTLVNESPLRIYNRAHELFQHEQYGEAQKHFLIYSDKAVDRETHINAQYYAGVCAMELFNPDAINLLLKVNRNYPEHSKSKQALFQLGKYFYRVKDNKSAIKYFEYVSAEDLTPADAEEFNFLKGYCYFKTDKFEPSKKNFSEIKDKAGKYAEAANYYYGYVVYKQGDYEDALTHFNKILNSKSFGPLAKVYVAQIYFLRKQYREVIGVGESVSEKSVLDDAAGIIGQSYYHLGQYDKAVPYLERYNANPPVSRTNGDVYRLAYAYLRSGQPDKAIDLFTSITSEKDTTAQYANYYLAEAFLGMGKKQAAKSAYQLAHKLNFNPEVTEQSLFNYARICAELGVQQEALKEFVTFINTYPNSKYNDEARSELSNLLLSTKNYKEAIRILESIHVMNENNKMAYQRVCYYRAEELYLNNEYDKANELFVKSQQYQYDKRLYALSYFWLAELQYKNSNFDKALELYRTFASFSQIQETRFYPLSSYNRAYCHLKLKDFSQCIDEMRKFIITEYALANPELYTDGMMRIADCYFALNQYPKAIESYDLIISRKLPGSDYALYQKAMILGVLNKPEEKNAALKTITTQFKRSTYIDDAYFEMANVYLQTEKYQAAVDGFNQIINEFPKSAFIRKSHLNKGLAYYNMSKDEEALAAFKRLITDFSTSEEAREALTVIKNIFINKGESDAYLAFISVLPNVTVSPSYQDSVTYESAFVWYKNGDCTKASKAFGNYIQKFAGGFFILKANYQKAECDFKLKNYDEALTAYEFVAAQNRNDYTERAVRQSAILHFLKKQYEKAFDYYASLERIASNRDNLGIALLGQMRSADNLNRRDTAAQVAFRYLNSTIVQRDGLVEAQLHAGRFYMTHQDPDSALVAFQYVVKETKNAMAAEAKYNLALIKYGNKDYKAARKLIFETADNYSAYEYWVAMAYLLLADTYIAEKDYFQAKATLESLIENYEGEDLRVVAREKLTYIIAVEEKLKDTGKKPVIEE
ncbi:MAG: tetratricopeptide repeat protein [Bacteroidia bacterium]|jgi:TolA-binding protein